MSAAGGGLKVIVAGSRTFKDYGVVVDAIARSGFEAAEVVSGREPNGVDALGERWARERGIPIKAFPADWDAHGRAAGPIRNRRMADYADALVAVWDGKSPGTFSMIKAAEDRGLKVFVHRVGG